MIHIKRKWLEKQQVYDSTKEFFYENSCNANDNFCIHRVVHLLQNNEKLEQILQIQDERR